jgi:hypothetical protein
MPNNDHLAEECNDPDCPRFPCTLWKRAIAIGEERGWDRCYPVAFMDGEAAGFAAGLAAGGGS